MNRNFYFYANLLLGLGAVSTFLQSVLYILLGTRIVMLDSFLGWFLVTSLVYVAGSLFLLKYFKRRNYTFAFYSSIIAIVLNVLLLAILYFMLVSGQMQNSSYIPVFFVATVAGMVNGVSFIRSPAGKSVWLKAAGYLILVIGTIFLVVLVWTIIDPEVRTNGLMEKVDQWTSLFRTFIPLLFLIQLSKESKLLRGENESAPVNVSLQNTFGFFGIIAFFCTAIFAFMIIKDGIGSLYWAKRNAERADELVQKSEERSLVNIKGDSLRYILMKPLNYDPQQKYPLVVCLPYGGYEAPAAQLLSSDVNREKYPAFLFVPYSPQGTSWGGVQGRLALDSLVYEAINSLNDQGIDVNRRYVSGVSLGGYGSWHFICTHPEMFAAAIPVCGVGNPELASKIVNIPVWAFHGEDDRNVPVSGSRDMVEAIKKAGGNPKYTEFAHKAHNIWYEVTLTPELLDWLFAQKRE
jgi:hypothetical protein